MKHPITVSVVISALIAFAASTVSVPALAGVVERQYGNGADDSVRPGESKRRSVYACDPAPYVATSPLAVAFAPKFEFPGEDWDVAGLRLNILVGRHRAVYAVDAGVLGNFADYKMDGIGIAGLFNSVGESDGAFNVAGILNFAAFDFSGCEIAGFYSCTEGAHTGLQMGLGNYAGSLEGVQIGVINYTERLNGVQIGLLNVNAGPGITFMPIVNLLF